MTGDRARPEVGRTVIAQYRVQSGHHAAPSSASTSGRPSSSVSRARAGPNATMISVAGSGRPGSGRLGRIAGGDDVGGGRAEALASRESTARRQRAQVADGVDRVRVAVRGP